MREKNILQTNAINFLLYSYFGITLDSTLDQIVETAIKKAYEDSTNQGAFNALDKQQGEESLEEIKERCTDEIKKALKSIGNDTFDEWHDQLCLLLVNNYRFVTVATKKAGEKKEAFSYGNAQKWVNMTIKYLYLLHNLYSEFSEKDCDFCKNIGAKIESISADLHVPVDSYIIDEIWKYNEVSLPLNTKGTRHKLYKTRNSEHVKPWSTWDEPEYKQLQKDLKEQLVGQSPIDWEGPAWIKVAEEIKQTELMRKNKLKSFHHADEVHNERKQV